MPSANDLSDRAYYNNLSWVAKRQVQALQQELSEAGFGQDEDFVQLACRREALRRFRQQSDAKAPAAEGANHAQGTSLNAWYRGTRAKDRPRRGQKR